MYNSESAALWLAERLKRPVSRITVHVYIKSGDLRAVNISKSTRPNWAITEPDLEAFARRSAHGLPTPTGGWPRQAKKVDGLAACATRPGVRH